jgi:predicted transposase YbfD/YdcC
MRSEKEFLLGFESIFGELNDKRQKSKVDYTLIEVIFLSIVAVAGGASSWEMIEGFGKAHLENLRNYYPFASGAPSDDTIRRVFEIIEPEQLNKALQDYFTQDLDMSGEHVAIDGKSLRGSKRGDHRALHMLNVYASGQGLTLFGKVIEAKTNEITAIPEAIELLDLQGAVVTIDAMGCQKNIAQKIIDKEAHYIFGLKENQVALYNEVKDAFETNAVSFFNMEEATSLDDGHGRKETRRCRVIQDLSKFTKVEEWPGLRSIIEVKRGVTKKGELTESTSYYISSSTDNAEIMLKNIRSHWKIESMHWMLDVVFNEDKSAMYKGNVPANMAIIRRFILNILNGMKGKGDTRPKLMLMIGWSPEYLHKFIQKLINRS